MKRVILTSILLLLLLVGVVVAWLNAGSVSFDLYFITTEAPLALLLYAALAIGVLVGFLASLVVVLSAKREARRLRKRLLVCEQEIKNLRELPIKGQF